MNRILHQKVWVQRVCRTSVWKDGKDIGYPELKLVGEAGLPTAQELTASDEGQEYLFVSLAPQSCINYETAGSCKLSKTKPSRGKKATTDYKHVLHDVDALRVLVPTEMNIISPQCRFYVALR